MELIVNPLVCKLVGCLFNFYLCANSNYKFDMFKTAVLTLAARKKQMNDLTHAAVK